MTLDTIYNEDCLEGMKRIPDGSIDAVICDPPYGTMKGSWNYTDFYDPTKHDWDDIIPTDKLFAEYERVLRRGGTIVLFSQEPYTTTCGHSVIETLNFFIRCIGRKILSACRSMRRPHRFRTSRILMYIVRLTQTELCAI